MTGEGASPTRHVVVMGVSGAGKTTVALGIATRTGLIFAEADEFHSPANVASMRAGVPLDDGARLPWLRDLAGWMADRAADGVSTVLACSALRRSYRDVLREGPPSVEFVHLDGSAEVIRERMARRAGHYMPASLLESQLATLEQPHPDESVLVLDVSLTPDELVSAAIDRLGLSTGVAANG
ncbi:gluconokinase [Micromonospora peucetia]|uniref:Gluconokinase n=1 Tax=Micromonospora peucetia TaxID=47871 RepID=A0A1C6W102_9ACTN|nr:gluconokinase [Micromonospora peucetia]MCX4390922.1 gluconokinase [Micromonospora peucetia]WSA31858.1 gluconokinase [Micromonospora peucetia]SCL72243.1 gluconate kinase, SKI family [Micromonospora peucetia]